MSSSSHENDLSAPDSAGPTGSSGSVRRAQAGDYLTTAQGLRLPDTDHSLKAGDRGLCAQVAAGLGLPAPKGSPAEDVVLSPALSQVVTEPGPIAGGKIGVIADAGADLAGIDKLRKAAEKHGASVLVIAPAGGVIGRGTREETVQRTLLTARSVEFDALVVAGGTTPASVIKLVLLLRQAFRHSKVLGAWGDGTAVLEAADIAADSAGAVTGDSVAKSFTDQLVAAVGLHRAQDRAPDVMASAVSPAAGA